MKTTTSWFATTGTGSNRSRARAMLATALVSGLGLGSIYGLIALGFTLTFAVSSTVNFAQGSSVMLGAVLCHVLAIGMHWPMWIAIPAALVACAAWGLIVERIA